MLRMAKNMTACVELLMVWSVSLMITTGAEYPGWLACCSRKVLFKRRREPFGTTLAQVRPGSLEKRCAQRALA